MLIFTEVPLGAQKQMPARILVRNHPLCYNEECLRMFYDNEIALGEGSVKAVTLSKEDESAIVEFKNDSSVVTVLHKQPIKMLGQVVGVERYVPYLEKSESLLSASIIGLGRKLSEDIKKLKLDELETGQVDSATAAEKEMKTLKEVVTMTKLKNDGLQMQIKQKNCALQKIKQDNDWLQNRFDRFSSENSSNEKEVKKLKEVVTIVKQKNEGLQMQIKQKDCALQKIKQKNGELQKRLEKISTENSTNEKEIKQLKEVVTKMKQENNGMQKRPEKYL